MVTWWHGAWHGGMGAVMVTWWHGACHGGMVAVMVAWGHGGSIVQSAAVIAPHTRARARTFPFMM
eukprot:363873-Chlamydomonas_euryale.AAC.15